MGLSEEVYRGIVKMGFRVPTPVQRKSLPVILSGTDTVVMARTGSGKTAAFCIPLLERLLNSQRRKQQQSASVNFSAGAVILSPTRELSLQTLKVLQTLSQFIEEPRLKCIGINGGESMEKQFALLSSNPDVIVATPGRLAHHLSEIPDFHLKHCDLMVFDEADRLFEMGTFHSFFFMQETTELQTIFDTFAFKPVGFAMQIREISNSMPNSESGRQTLLFSATMPKILVEFTKSGIMDSDPQVVRLDKDASVSDELRIGFITVRSQEKDGALLHLLRDVLPNAIKKDDKNPEQKKLQKKKKGKNDDKEGQKKKKKGTNDDKEDDEDEDEGHALGMTLIFAATRHHVDYLTALINNAGLGKGPGDLVAACIYGTMDQEARKLNLSAFRSGRIPILIVTDVAARGIDIPLIDHVVHYSFPPTAKLFVHRSGRAARAGRIGYCWGLVDTEEMPYMVDLYLFLGRKLSTGNTKAIKAQEEDDGKDGSHEEQEDVIYSVQEMTPDMVHYGSVPESTSTQEVENVRRIMESELTGSHDAELLRSLVRICNNAMKQYRRSRPEASRQGVRRAKAILEGKKEQSGKRVGGGMLPAHPVLRKAEIDKIMGLSGTTQESAKKKLNEMKQREVMLRAMSNFRPKETVFEAFATGGGKATGILGQVDKGRTTAGGSSKKYDASAAYTSMKNMRRQMALAHQKGTSLVVAGSDKALVMNGELEESAIKSAAEDEIDSLEMLSSMNTKASPGKKSKTVEVIEKRRLSKAERKRMKKTGSKVTAQTLSESDPAEKRVKDKRGSEFRDAAFYIDNMDTTTEEEDQRSRHIEAAMQPSAASGNDGMTSALRLEEAMLDIVGDENADLVKKQRITRWDKSKRKYVQTTVGMETSGMSKTKKLKLESGQMVNSKKVKLGELYEKWQKKTNKSIGRVGVFDDVTGDNDTGVADPSGYARKTPTIKKKQVDDDGIKTATQIRKKREVDQKTKIKNMPKKERSQLYLNKRAAQNKKNEAAAASGKGGWQGKRGFSGRFGQQMKGKPVNKGK